MIENRRAVQIGGSKPTIYDGLRVMSEGLANWHNGTKAKDGSELSDEEMNYHGTVKPPLTSREKAREKTPFAVY
ncbi:MAG: hypothetical protein ACYC3G_00235 [Minisyncoccota bacterium]